MKKITKRQIFVWVLALAPLVLIAAAYGRLPDRVPMQWDFGGQVGYEPKWHLWITAGLAPLFAVLLYFLPALDPKKRNYSKFSGSYVGLPDRDDAVPARDERHLCGRGAAAEHAGHPHGGVPGVSLIMVYIGNYHAQVPHELVLRHQDAVDAVE